MSESDKYEISRAKQYFRSFLEKVNDCQLTRFENYAYKHCVSLDSEALKSLSLWAGCELVARNFNVVDGVSDAQV